MLYVRIELWPGGQRENARLLQELTIVNDGDGDERIGHYDAVLSHSTLYKGSGFADPVQPRPAEVWRRGRVHQFLRVLSPAELVMKALAATLRCSIARGRS